MSSPMRRRRPRGADTARSGKWHEAQRPAARQVRAVSRAAVNGQLQVVPLMAKEAGTALVVPFQLPLNPIPDKVAPGAILPL